jgi:hypothetical protein
MSLEPSSNRYEEKWHIYHDTKPEAPASFHGKEITVCIDNIPEGDSHVIQTVVKNVLENVAEAIVTKLETKLDIEQISLTYIGEGKYDVSLKHPNEELEEIIFDISSLQEIILAAGPADVKKLAMLGKTPK